MSSARRPDDVRRRIYVGAGHLKQDIPEAALQQVEMFLKRTPHAFAMLEFTSPGPDRRQIDCALVSPGGIDIIEVKRHPGVIEGTADGLWRRRDSGKVISNTKRGVTENPYQQALNTAADFTAWLDTKYGVQVRVTPSVFMPHADPASPLGRSDHVRLALGNTQRAFSAALRSAFRDHGGGWNGADPWDLPSRLGLQPMNLSFLQGRVINASEHAPVAGLSVWVEVSGERMQVTTSDRGYYEFAVQLQDDVLIGVVTPDRYHAPEPVQLRATQPFLNVDDMVLTERFGPASEEEVRAKVEQDLRAQWQEQLSRTEAAWNDTQVAMGLVIDDLQTRLKTVLDQLTDRERALHEALRAGPQGGLPLPVLVRQASELNLVEAQRSEVTGAMRTLQAARQPEQQAAVQDVIGVLSRVGAGRQSLPAPVTTDLAVRVTQVTARLPTPLPPEDVVFTEEPVTPRVRNVVVRPASSDPAPGSGVASPGGPGHEAAPPATGSTRAFPWPWAAGALAVLTVGLIGLLAVRPPADAARSVPTSPVSGAQQGPSAPVDSVVSPTPVTEEAAVSAPLPGEPVEAPRSPAETVTVPSAAPASAAAVSDPAPPVPAPEAAPARPSPRVTPVPAAPAPAASPVRAATTPAAPRPATTPVTPVRTAPATPAPGTAAESPAAPVTPEVTSDATDLPGVPVGSTAPVEESAGDAGTGDDLDALPGVPVGN